jgi:hypothetical protein
MTSFATNGASSEQQQTENTQTGGKPVRTTQKTALNLAGKMREGDTTNRETTTTQEDTSIVSEREPKKTPNWSAKPRFAKVATENSIGKSKSTERSITEANLKGFVFLVFSQTFAVSLIFFFF